MLPLWQQCWYLLPLLPAQRENGKSRSVRSCCSLYSVSHVLTSVFQQPSLFKIKQTKMQTKQEKRKKEFQYARCLCSGCLCFKVLLLESCTSHDGICQQAVHVCALKGIEAMSEIRKDYCLIRWSLIICPLKLAFLINKKTVAVAQR